MVTFFYCTKTSFSEIVGGDYLECCENCKHREGCKDDDDEFDLEWWCNHFEEDED